MMTTWRKKATEKIAEYILSRIGFQQTQEILPVRRFGVLIDYAAIRQNLIRRRSQSLEWLWRPILRNGLIDFGGMFFTQDDILSSAMRTFSTQEHLFCVCGTAEQKKTTLTLAQRNLVLDGLYRQMYIAANHLIDSCLTDIVVVGQEPYCRTLAGHFTHKAAWRGKRFTALNAENLEEAQIGIALRDTAAEKPALVLEPESPRQTVLLIDYSNVDKLFETGTAAIQSLLEQIGNDIAFGCAFVPQGYVNTAVLREFIQQNDFLFVCCPFGHVPALKDGRYDTFRPKDVDTVDAKLCAMTRHVIACMPCANIVIMSGDGDFVGVTREAQWHRKRVITVGMQGRISPLLFHVADEVLVVPSAARHAE